MCNLSLPLTQPTHSHMNRFLLLLTICIFCNRSITAQNLADKANLFIGTLTDAQKTEALYPFDTAERYRFMYVPLDDRKGISMNELNTTQQAAAMDLLKTSLSEETVQKVRSI